MQSPEDVGKQIAGSMSDFFDRSTRRESAQELVKKRHLQARTRLRDALYEAVDGFNGQAPWDFHLAVINRNDCMIFNSFGEFTLTVTFEEDRVRIERIDVSDASGLKQAPFLVDIRRVHGALRYCRMGLSGSGQESPLTELQFVDSVIRMACHWQLGQRMAC